MVTRHPLRLGKSVQSQPGLSSCICKCRRHKAGHLQVRVAVGRQSTCVLKDTPLKKGPLGLPHQPWLPIGKFRTGLGVKFPISLFFEPEVLQSGFGVNFIFWHGELWENCRRINFDGEKFAENFPQIFRPCFLPGFQARPKNSHPKFTPRIVGIPLQFHFLEPNCFFHADFLLTGEINIFPEQEEKRRKTKKSEDKQKKREKAKKNKKNNKKFSPTPSTAPPNPSSLAS